MASLVLLPGALKHQAAVLTTTAAMFGCVAAARAALSALVGPKYANEDFDARYGVDTTAASNIDSAIPDAWMAEAVHYEPANVKVLHHVFRSVPFRHQDYHLVDLGCGKGRTLLVGAEYPFRAVTGIELSPVTSAIAADNIARSRRRQRARCPAIDVRCENAVDFDVPSGHLFVTMYNPFLGRTFQQCIEHLHRAAVAHPERRIWLAYINHWHCQDMLEQSGYFQRVQTHRPVPRNWTWSLWTHV